MSERTEGSSTKNWRTSVAGQVDGKTVVRGYPLDDLIGNVSFAEGIGYSFRSWKGPIDSAWTKGENRSSFERDQRFIATKGIIANSHQSSKSDEVLITAHTPHMRREPARESRTGQQLNNLKLGPRPNHVMRHYSIGFSRFP